MRAAWIAVLLSLAATAIAKEPGRDVTSILARLQDTAPAEIAWGAYLSGAEGTEDAIPLLIGHLRPNSNRTGKEWDLAHRAILDALIRLDAKVPSEVLVPLLGTRPRTMALILIAREPVKNRAILLDRFDRGTKGQKLLGADTVGVGNLLVKSRSPGVAVRLMRRQPTTLTIHVGASDNVSIGLGGGAGGGFGDGLVTVPEGFPPHVRYEFVDGKPLGLLTLFADGPNPISLRRTERSGRRFGVGTQFRRYERIGALNGWVAAMLEAKPATVWFRPQDMTHVRFQDAERYIAKATHARDHILETYWSIARQLVDRKLMTLAEAKALEFSVKVVIEDERDDKSIPLPVLPATTVGPDWPEK